MFTTTVDLVKSRYLWMCALVMCSSCPPTIEQKAWLLKSLYWYLLAKSRINSFQLGVGHLSYKVWSLTFFAHALLPKVCYWVKHLSSRSLSVSRRSTLPVTSITHHACVSTSAFYLLPDEEMPREMLQVIAPNPSIVRVEVVWSLKVTICYSKIAQSGLDACVLSVHLEPFFIVLGFGLLAVSKHIRALSSILSNSFCSSQSVATLL